MNLFVLIRILLLVVLLSSCSDDVQHTPLMSSDTIVAFGDSLTFGIGSTKGANYPEVLGSHLNQRVINAGISGEQTSASLLRIDKILDKYQPSLVLLCIGGNDFLRKQPKQRIIDNIRRLIIKIRLSGAKVLLIAVPEASLFLSPSPIYKDLADELDVVLVQDSLTDLLSERQYKSDTIHLNNMGYRLLAESIIETMKNTGWLQ